MGTYPIVFILFHLVIWSSYLDEIYVPIFDPHYSNLSGKGTAILIVNTPQDIWHTKEMLVQWKILQ